MCLLAACRVRVSDLMRIGGRWLLIDMDASARFNHNVGAKSSAAFCCPEMVRLDPPRIVKDSDEEPVLASPAIDLWALGAVLFQMCTGRALFEAFSDDTLDESGLRKLAAWSKADVKASSDVIRNRKARHLVSRLLAPDPADRLPLDQVLSHPFVTNEEVKGRLVGEIPHFDAFIGYRVATDLENVARLYCELTRLGYRVFWDKNCLAAGRDWEEGFCDGITTRKPHTLTHAHTTHHTPHTTHHTIQGSCSPRCSFRFCPRGHCMAAPTCRSWSRPPVRTTW